MAETITITCPECDKKITVAAASVGKKIRCKGCEHIFVVTAPAAAKAAGKPAAKAPAGKPAAGKAAEAKKTAPDAKAEKPKFTGDDEDDDGKAYGITSLDSAPRCPDCANEMESEDAILCLVCGYNTRTRTKAETVALEDTTGMTWFLWLLPGILYAVGFLVVLTFDIWYSVKIDVFVDKDNDWFAFIASAWFKIWIIWMPSILFSVVAVRFAVLRLIMHPRPPERVKKKAKEVEE